MLWTSWGTLSLGWVCRCIPPLSASVTSKKATQQMMGSSNFICLMEEWNRRTQWSGGQLELCASCFVTFCNDVSSLSQIQSGEEFSCTWMLARSKFGLTRNATTTIEFVVGETKTEAESENAFIFLTLGPTPTLHQLYLKDKQ